MNSTLIAEQLAKRFISRRDVKAIQLSDGTYRPVNAPFQMQDLIDHVEGRKTYGHYLLDEQSHCKFFAFDCDLEETGTWIQQADLSGIPVDAFTGPDAEHWFQNNSFTHTATPRIDWHDRAHPGRGWWKFQMRCLAELLSSTIRSQLGIPVVCSYSGNKGVHVYGLTGYMPAADVREAAKLILAATGRFVPTRGDNFYRDTATDWRDSYANFQVEVFPKQDTVEPGHYGNLMRLPLGRNLKSIDPAFLLDQTTAHVELAPHADPAALLIEGNPWQ